MTICSLRDLQKGQKQRRPAAEEKFLRENDAISKIKIGIFQRTHPYLFALNDSIQPLLEPTIEKN